jgi:sugar phosphate isomerase/epimerase
MHTSTTRRDFLAGTIMGAAALTVGNSLGAVAQPAGEKRFKIVAFSKSFQAMNYEETADLVAEIGWDGIECPVRAKGHVEAERVEDDLPKLVEAMKKRGREVAIITTDVREVTPLNERVLRTASKLGIRKYRLGFASYGRNKAIPAQLDEIRAKYRDLVALNKELNMQAGHQNHSGAEYVGGPVWDIYLLIKDFDPRYLAVHFDIGHATLEGGMCWPTNARLMQPFFGAVYVKDFVWEKGPSGWRSRWVLLGQGMVKKSFFDDLKKSDYRGVISQHHEYLEANATRQEMVSGYKKDVETLKAWLG